MDKKAIEPRRRKISEAGLAPTFSEDVANDEGYPPGYPEPQVVEPTKQAIEIKGSYSDISPSRLSLRDKSFCNNIKILLIHDPVTRVICSFFDIVEPDGLISEFFIGPMPIISDLVVQCIQPYMESLGYNICAELLIDDQGEVYPVSKRTQKAKGKDISYTTNGLVFYENGETTDKAVFFVSTDSRGTFFTLWHVKQKISNKLLAGLKKYAKENNFLRGAKIRSVDPMSSTFYDMDDEIKDSYTWDNYYYPKEIIDVCEKDIFDFLRNSRKYASKGIERRGILLHGDPGAGKTSIGKVLCNYLPEISVIWVTPDMAIQLMTNIYELAGYLKPCVMILEDLDLFAEDRDNSSENFRLGVLMNILDGVNSVEETVTIATTNRIDLIEKALQNRPGRFDRVVHVPTLTEDLRRKFIKNNLSDYTVSDNVVEFLVRETSDGQKGSSWSGAELAELIKCINMNLIYAKRSAKKITMKMAEEALETMNSFIFCKKGQDSKNAIGFD